MSRFILKSTNLSMADVQDAKIESILPDLDTSMDEEEEKEYEEDQKLDYSQLMDESDPLSTSSNLQIPLEKPQTSTTILSCPVCPTLPFNKKPDYNRHLLTHAIQRQNRAKKLLFCRLCPKTAFKTLDGLGNHLAKNHRPEDQKPIIKSEIDRSYSDEDEEPPPPKPVYVCNICSKEWKALKTLEKHVKACQLKQEYLASLERKAQERERAAQENNSSDSEEEEIDTPPVSTNIDPTCPVCPATFQTPSELTKHLAIDHMEKFGTTRCPVCKWNFRTGWKTHVKIHSGEAGYLCPVCRGAFITHVDYVRHVEEHKPLWKYSCPYCVHTFPIKLQVEIHSQHTHSMKSYPCPLIDCMETFKEETELENHMKGHPKQRFCFECEEKFEDKGHFRTHKKLHKAKGPLFKCSLCDETYFRYSIYTRHVGLPHDLSCFQCDRSFINKNMFISHFSNTHWMAKAQDCPHCSETFRSIASFVDHVSVCQHK